MVHTLKGDRTKIDECKSPFSPLSKRRILHAPGAISVHGSVSPGKPRTRALRSEAEGSSDLATAGPEAK